MIAPILPSNEKQRQAAVEKYELLDTLPEESYDAITKLMCFICDVPISLITLIDKDRNFLKSHHGVPLSESPREISFCGHAIVSDDPITIIEDSRKDIRFDGNPLVTDYNAIFYAGAPLVDTDGFKLGTLCIYDNKPRKLSEAQKEALLSLSKQVTSLFEQRYQNFKLKQAEQKLRTRNENLKKFAGIVSHDLKSPLANIILLTELLKSENENNFSEGSKEYLDILKESSLSLSNYIEGMLDFYRTDDISKQQNSCFTLQEIIDDVRKLCALNEDIKIIAHNPFTSIYTNKSALTQIFTNLFTNAIKYNKSETIEITVTLTVTNFAYNFSVKDNGIGIKLEQLNGIFDLFETYGTTDRYGNLGTGIGLAAIKKIITTLGGDISVNSAPNKGSDFLFSLPKND